MSDSIKFSIIVPCYNVEAYIAECVESVIHQTYANWELLLVDDASEDNTFEVANNLSKRDERIHVYTKEHGGLPHTRNYGLQYVTGDYLSLLDGDDYWASDHLEKVAAIIKKKDSDMIIQNQHTNFTRKSSNQVILFPMPAEKLTPSQKLEIIFSPDNCLPASAVLTTYKVDFLKKNKIKYGDQYSCSEDLDFFLHAIAQNPNISFAGHEFYFYRQDNQGAMTKSISGSMELDRLSIYKKWFDYYEGRTIDQFNCKKIQNKIAKEMLVQIHVYRNISANDPQKKDVKKYLIKNRYLYSPNGIKGSFLFAFYLGDPMNKLKEKLANVHCKLKNGDKPC